MGAGAPGNSTWKWALYVTASMPEPLPTNPFKRDLQPTFHSAYLRCLDLEHRHAQVPQRSRLTVIICARFLGYILLEAPTDEGRKIFASEINQCAGDEELQMLAQVYTTHLLRVFRRNKGRTPTPTSFDEQAMGFSALLTPTHSSHQAAKAEALERDGYRCVFSGKLDNNSIEANLVVDDGSQPVTVTELAHIFDRSTNEDLETDKKTAYATSALAVLSRFGQIDAIKELNGAGLHRLENTLTLAPDVHNLFDNLKIWLERVPSDPPNHYRLAATQPRLLRGLYPQVSFISPNPVTHPPPDPRYLALHAACARASHLSGVGEYVDQILRDIELSTGVLASDGQSDVLYFALIHRLDVEVEAY